MHSITLDWRRQAAGLGEVAAPEIGRNTAILFVHLVLLLFLIAAGLLYRAVQMDADNLLYPMCLAFTLSMVWILASWFSLRGTLFEPHPLFMIAAGMFNGGQALLELFGLNGSAMLDGRVPPDNLIGGLYLVTVSLLATHAGALLAIGRKSGVGARAGLGLDSDRQQGTRIVGWTLLAIAAVPAFLLLKSSVSIVLDYGYMWLYRRQESIAVTWALSAMLVPGIVFLLAGARNSRGIQGFCLALTAVYAAINLFLGARGAVVMSGISIAWIYDRVGRRIPRSLIATLAVVTLVVCSAVRETRSFGGAWRGSLDQQIGAIADLQNPISSSISEMGYSLVTVTHTLALVPAVRGFDYGASYLYAASAIVPNLGWEVHPGVAHGLLSEWLTRTVDPTIAASGGGLGYSFIAEAYLNFGWVGGPLWLAFMGYFFSRLFQLADAPDAARQALVASLLSFILVLARGESAIVVRGLVWYAFVPYLFACALSIHKHRRSMHP